MVGNPLLLLCFMWWTHYAHASTSRGPPKILGRDFKPLQVARVGEEFRVACPIEGEPSPNIDWFKDGEPITSAWSRFRVNSKALRIRSVFTKDSGIYECKGVNGFGSIIARTRLVVPEEKHGTDHEPDELRNYESSSIERRDGLGPTFTSETLEQSGPLHIPSGNNIRFKCDSNGSPPAKIMWFKDGKAVSEKMLRWESWTLVLSKLTSEDSGSYTCKASNSFGIHEINIQLEVAEMMEKRRPMFVLGFPNNASVFAGNEVTMECIVRGENTAVPPHIKWLKRIPLSEAASSSLQNKLLIPVENQHVLVIQDSEDEGIRVNETQINGTFISKLIFKQATPGMHDGIYVCLATNSVGYTFRDAHLTVMAGAEIIENPPSGIPFPLIVLILSVALSLIVIGSACFLRNYQKTQQKQSQALSVRKLTTTTPTVSVGSSNSNRSSSYQKRYSSSRAQRQLLVVPTTMHPSTHINNVLQCQSAMMREPTIEISLSRCSYCGDESSEISAVRTYEHCYNGSYISSTSHHSLHCGAWT